MDPIEWAVKAMKVSHEELAAWRRRHPREASAVHEEALAKVEGRKPIYGAPQAFGGAPPATPSVE